jgi:hypothetical protein
LVFIFDLSFFNFDFDLGGRCLKGVSVDSRACGDMVGFDDLCVDEPRGFVVKRRSIELEDAAWEPFGVYI